MRPLVIVAAVLAATPAAAAGPTFFSLANTDFIVLLAFLLFIGILVYYKVPGIITAQLDKRADSIRSELEEARALREEAQSLLASYERKQAEVEEQADKIVERAREDARREAEQAKKDLEETIDRRLEAAEEQIRSAEAAAIREVRNRAAEVAVAAAAEILADKTGPERHRKLFDSSLETVGQRLN